MSKKHSKNGCAISFSTGIFSGPKKKWTLHPEKLTWNLKITPSGEEKSSSKPSLLGSKSLDLQSWRSNEFSFRGAQPKSGFRGVQKMGPQNLRWKLCCSMVETIFGNESIPCSISNQKEAFRFHRAKLYKNFWLEPKES